MEFIEKSPDEDNKKEFISELKGLSLEEKIDILKKKAKEREDTLDL